MERFNTTSIIPTIPGGNKSVELFSLLACYILDLPSTGMYCSERDPNVCVLFKYRAAYLLGGSVNDMWSAGHVVYRAMWGLILLIGTFGIGGNILVIIIFKRIKGEGGRFRFMIKVLAVFDIFCCLMSILNATGRVAYLDNWEGRGLITAEWFYHSWLFLLFGRSASVLMTMIITIERYVVIAYPLHSKSWFTKGRTRFLAVFSVILATVFFVPRVSSFLVADNTYNEDGFDITPLRGLKYILRSTRYTSLWYGTLKGIHNQIDFWLPLPVLLIFNFLTYRHVRKAINNRKQMSTSRHKEIQAVKIFLPVVVVLFVCFIEPIVHYMIIHFYKIIFRELSIGMVLSIALNSACNFPIYYYLGEAFRAETRASFARWFKREELKAHKILSNSSSTSGQNP